ncbi:MAG TPA: ATPase domain-containing protein [Opitutaceae bacterium]|nr:ATPase domain-containing protein [Opitutaceae bacterium]
MQSPPSGTPTDPLAPTGILGLDHILRGGLPAHRLYLLRGEPGSGKTTLALQFLLAGVEEGEVGLYITLSETKDEVEAVARSHGWNLDRLAIFELSALEQQLKLEAQNTVFHPSEVELNETTGALIAKIEEVKPRRIALDSLSELRLLADSALRYRRQMLALKQYFAGKKITVMMLDDHAGPEGGDLHVQSIAHGVILIEQQATDYGAKRRRIEVMKLRGVDFVGGYHDAAIVRGGLQVFPRLIASEHGRAHDPAPLKTGNPRIDDLLGGGLGRGTSCLLLGPAGAGKSTLAMHFSAAAAKRGEKVFVYLFEENLELWLRRAEALGMPLRQLVKEGTVSVRQIDPAHVLPGEFVHIVQRNVENEAARVIVIDSMNGYMQAMPAAKFLMIQLHELQAFLARYGVITLMTVAQHGVLGQMQSPVDLTYLADAVILLRYFEERGEIRKAISVVKNRDGQHETAIRELNFGKGGLQVGEPLRDFRGVLTGVPAFTGNSEAMIRRT